MHDRNAVGQALGELQSLQALRLVRRQFDALQLGLVDQLAARDHLGQDHGDDLQVLDLVLGIDALGAVLHDQHADSPPAAQQGHAEEGVVRVFARFRTIGEGWVFGRVRQVQRPAQAHDLADQAFARLHAGIVHGGRVQALGGEQLQIVGRPP